MKSAVIYDKPESTMSNYYVISTDYNGPNAAEHLNSNTIEIRNEPMRGNSGDRPEITDGWCGTTNDWSVYAHGEYETLEAARAALHQIEPATRPDTSGLHCDEATYESFLVGAYNLQSENEVGDWLYFGMSESVTAETTDAQLAELAGDFELIANEEGMGLNDEAIGILCKYRDELREDV
jgi:hypothetical protein